MAGTANLPNLRSSLVSLLLLAAPAEAASRGMSSSNGSLDQTFLQALEWRSIGPYRGGRVTAVAGVTGQPRTFYFGATGGGVWKTTDGGITWQNVTDGQIGTGSVGAIAVAEADPNVVYVGMGESCIRGNVSHGDGVYRSTDAGRTWTHVGLADSRQIGRIRVHPRDPDLVYVAALGHTFGPNRERGLYRSRDGGTTWQKILAVSDSAGAVDLAMDPGNPRVLYAAFWQVYRTPWSLVSGGRGSGLYKSTDGGESWRKLSSGGLPKGLWGRVAVAVTPGRSERVWALIEADEGGLFRSEDAGKTWRRTSEDRRLRQRAWYYNHLYADPRSPDAVYVLNVQFLRSGDGGRTFQPIVVPHGDNHDLWVDPTDPLRMIEGNDGGANVSFDGGATWSTEDNQPTGQFYHVVTDDRFPYRVYGAQQDNSTVSIASRTAGSGIDRTDWYTVGGCESGFVAPTPGEPDVAYAGCYDGVVTRHDHRTGEVRNVSVYPENPMGWGAEGMKYRFQWTFPIAVSPHAPHALYAAGNVLFRSTNQGQSWTAISPDLTRNDPSRLGPSGGPITKDNTSVEYYCTIFAFAESRLAKGLLWAGSDDGLVHLSRDDGAHWSDVTPHDLPPWSRVSQIDPSPHDPGTAYLAANRYQLDDYRPYAYVTHDYGRSWRRISAGLPAMAFVRVVREDPVRRGLLYAGTELGGYFSLDQGGRWQPLRMNLPDASPALRDSMDAGARTGLLPLVPVTDLVVKDDDVVISTQGRGFWILDDVSPLRQGPGAGEAGGPHLFSPAPAYRYGGPVGGTGRGQNPPYGARVYYRLSSEPGEKDEVTLEFSDATGRLVRKFSSKGDKSDDDLQGAERGGDAPPPAEPSKLPAKKGLNRFAWNLRYPDAKRFRGMILWGGGLQGPTGVPGRYRVKLTAAGKTVADSFEVRKDPRLATTSEDDRARFDLQLEIRDKLSEAHEAITRLRDVRDQVKAVAERSKTASRDTTIAHAARILVDRLTAVEEALYQTKNRSNQDPLNYPIKLNNKLSALAGVVEGTEGRPTEQSYEVFRDLAAKTDRQLGSLRDLLAKDLTAFNQLVSDQRIPAVVAKEEKPEGEKAGARKP